MNKNLKIGKLREYRKRDADQLPVEASHRKEMMKRIAKKGKKRRGRY